MDTDPIVHRAAFPHCDSRVLHAPGECKHCDRYPDWQRLRETYLVNFTGKNEPGKTQCPAERQRPLATINRWGGNRPQAAAEDTCKHVEAVIVESSQHRDFVSLRGPKGRGEGDGIHQHLTRAGYKPGERVIILPQADYDALCARFP